MSFYGNITNTARSPFTFDRIYSSRYAMEQAMTSDGVYAGRYVLVEYDKDFSNIEFHRAYRDVSELKEETHTLYKDSACTIPITVQQNPGEIDAPEVGSIFYTVEDSVFISEVLWINARDASKIGSNTDPVGQNYYIIKDGEKCYFNKEFVAENDITLQISNNSNNTHSLVQVFAIVQNGYAFYECQGSNSEGENEDEPEDFTASFAYLALSQGQYATGTIENYLSNHTLDLLYYNRPQGYDSTVWQKIYVDEEEKYIMIADLNTQAPTITVSADAPSSQPSPPHFDPSSTNTMYDLHQPTQWGFRVKAADKTLSEGGMIYDEESELYVPFFEQTARYIDTAVRNLIDAENTYYNSTIGAERLWNSNYNLFKNAINESLSLIDPAPTLPQGFYDRLELILSSYDSIGEIPTFIIPTEESSSIQLQIAGDGVPTIDYLNGNNKINLYNYLVAGNANDFSPDGGLSYVFENQIEGIFREYYYYKTSVVTADEIYSFAIETIDNELREPILTISEQVVDRDLTDYSTRINGYLDLMLSTISKYEYGLAQSMGLFTEETDDTDKVLTVNSSFTEANKIASNKVSEYEEMSTYAFNKTVISIMRRLLSELLTDYIETLDMQTEDEDEELVEMNPLTAELIENKTVKVIEDLNYYLRQIINTSLKSDADATWLNIQNDTRYYFDGITASWSEDDNNTIAGDIYFNKDGFDSSERSKVYGRNEITITPTGYGQHYNPETKAWETYKYNLENRTVYGEKMESPDTQELSIHLPAIGDTISDVWDLTYGKQRNKDIAWESKDPNKLQLTVEKEDGNGFTYTPKQVETIAGVINSTQNLMGKIIIDNPDNRTTSGAFADSNDVYNLLDDDHIYYFTEDSSYFRRAWDYDYSKIPDNDENNNHLITTKEEYENKVQALNPVNLVNPFGIPRNDEVEFSEYTLAKVYDENLTYYRKDGDDYIELNNNLLVFEPDTYYIKKASGTYYYKDGENYYWGRDYQSGRKYFLIKATENVFAPLENEYRQKQIDKTEYSDFNWDNIIFNADAKILTSEQDYVWGSEYFDLTKWQSPTYQKCYLWQPGKYYTREPLTDDEGNPIYRENNGNQELVYKYILKQTYESSDTAYFLKTKNEITSVEYDEETGSYQYYVEQDAKYSSAVRVGNIDNGNYYIKKEDLFESLLTTITDTTIEDLEKRTVRPFSVVTAFTSTLADVNMIDKYVAMIIEAYNVTYESIQINNNVTINKAILGSPKNSEIWQTNPAINFDGYLEVLSYQDNTTEDNSYFPDSGETPLEPPVFYQLLDNQYVEKYVPQGYYYRQRNESGNIVGYVLDVTEDGSEDREYVTIEPYPIDFKVYEPGQYYYPINDFDYRFVLADPQPNFIQVADSSALENVNFNVYSYYSKTGNVYSRATEWETGVTYYTTDNFNKKEYYIQNTGENNVEAPYIRDYSYDETKDYYIKEYDTSTMDFAVSLLPAVSTKSVQGYIPRQILNSLTPEELDEVVTFDVVGDYFYYAYAAPDYENAYKEASPQPTAQTYNNQVYYVQSGDNYIHPQTFIEGLTYYTMYQKYSINTNTGVKTYINRDVLEEIIATKHDNGQLDSSINIKYGLDIPYKYTIAKPQPTQDVFNNDPEQFYVKSIIDSSIVQYEHLDEYNALRVYYTKDDYFTTDGEGIPILYNSDDYEYIACDENEEYSDRETYYRQTEVDYSNGLDDAREYSYEKLELSQNEFNAIEDKTTLYIRHSLAGQAEYTVLYRGYDAYDDSLTYYEYTPYYVTQDYLEYRAGQRWDWSVGWENYALSTTDDYFVGVDYYVDNAGQTKAQFYKPNEYYFKYEPNVYYIEDNTNTYYKIADGNFDTTKTYYYDPYGQAQVRFYEPNKYYYETISSISKDSSSSLSNSKLYYLDKNGHEQIFFETYAANEFYYGNSTTSYVLDTRTYFDESETYYSNNTGTAITLVPYYPNMYYIIETPIASEYNPDEVYFTSAANASNTSVTGSTLSQLEFEQNDWYIREEALVDEYSRAQYFDAVETYYTESGGVYTQSNAPTANTDFTNEVYYVKSTITNYKYTLATVYNANVGYWKKLSPTSITQNATYVLIGNLTAAEFNKTTYYLRKYKLCDDATVVANKTYYTNTNGSVAGNLYKPNTYYIAVDTVVATIDTGNAATSGREYFYDEFLENRVYLTSDYAANKYYSATVSYIQDTAASITPYRMYYLNNNANNPVRLETYYKDRFYIIDDSTHYRLSTDVNVNTSLTYYTDLSGTDSIIFTNGYSLADGPYISGATYYKLNDGVYEEIDLWDYQPNMYYINRGDNAETIINCRLVPKDFLDKKDNDGIPLFKTYYLAVLDGFARDYNTIHGLILRLNQWMNEGNVTTRDLDTIQGALNALQDQIRRLGAYDYSTIYNLNNTVNMIALKAEELIAEIDALNAEVAAQGGYATRDYVLTNFLLKHRPGDDSDTYVELDDFNDFYDKLLRELGTTDGLTDEVLPFRKSIQGNLIDLDSKIGNLQGSKLKSHTNVTTNLVDLYDQIDGVKSDLKTAKNELQGKIKDIKAGIKKMFTRGATRGPVKVDFKVIPYNTKAFKYIRVEKNNSYYYPALRMLYVDIYAELHTTKKGTGLGNKYNAMPNGMLQLVNTTYNVADRECSLSLSQPTWYSRSYNARMERSLNGRAGVIVMTTTHDLHKNTCYGFNFNGWVPCSASQYFPSELN